MLITNEKIRDYNRQAWDKEVERGNPWTKGVTAEIIYKARLGEWSVVLTPMKPVPARWFPAPLMGKRVLCLASGGGQQGPILAAAGADVTVFDNSPAQLSRDREIADREGLQLKTVEGDMRDLSVFSDESFDLVFQPVANCFIPSLDSLWKESARVLRRGGLLLAGFINPVSYLWDREREAQGEFVLKYAAPYSDMTSIAQEELARYTNYLAPIEFGHTLEQQLAGQMANGIALVDLFEDSWGGSQPIDKYFNSFVATRGIKQ